MTPNPSLVDPASSRADNAAASDGSDSDAGATTKPGLDPPHLEKTAPGDPAFIPAGASDASDHSLEAILLQAGARPSEPRRPTPIGSRTLMGVGVEGLDLTALRRSLLEKTKAGETKPGTADAAPATAATGSDLGDTSGESRPNDTHKKTGKTSSNLLDEVALALNVQASEVRDRARARLPGVGTKTAAPNTAPPGHARGRAEPEPEEPDDGPTALTPGVTGERSSGHKTSKINTQAGTQDGPRHLAPSGMVHSDEEEAVVLGRTSPSGPTATALPKIDGRPAMVPPVPGSSAVQSGPIGPPPGFQPRTTTPSGGIPLSPSSRLRFPAANPGSSGPPGQHPPHLSMSGLAVVPLDGLMTKDADLTATAPSTPISLEASRRFAASMGHSAASTSTPVARRVRTTQRIALEAARGLPAVMKANVKLATASLAGLIAVTFIGGLFVGMLVWKGQGQSQGQGQAQAQAHDTVPPSRVAGAPAPASSGTTVAPTTVAPTTAATAAPAVIPAAPPAPLPSTAAAASVAKRPTQVVVQSAPTASVSAAPTSARDDIDPDDSSTRPAKHAASTTVTTKPPRARRPVADAADGSAAPAPTTAKTPAPKPAARPGTSSSGSKPMATNSSASGSSSSTKPASKSKSKGAWHDPFAD